MESYADNIAPPGGSPELPGSEEPRIKSSKPSGGCKTKMLILAAAVALVSIGVTSLMTSGPRPSSPCENRVEALTKQALSDKEAMKAKLDKLHEDLAAAERAAMGLESAPETSENVVRFAWSDNMMFTDEAGRFVASVVGVSEVEAGQCESDSSGTPSLASGSVPTTALAKDDLYYFVPGYHYEIIDEDGSIGCRKVEHDLAWLDEDLIAPSLQVVNDLPNEEALVDYVGEVCGDTIELGLMQGTEEVPLLYWVGLPEGVAVSDECYASIGMEALYSPVTEKMYVFLDGGGVDDLMVF